ncbi:MAG: hypothetical protein QNJ54_01715 [Prochloraceae cyanobacterium]|nr:hypothetical protein [Prochloraceae cyanobacterium]
MSNTTNTEIQEIKQLIQDLSERVDKRFDKLEQEVKELQIVSAKIEGLMKGWEPMINKLPDLSQQLGQQHALEANSYYCHF